MWVAYNIRNSFDLNKFVYLSSIPFYVTFSNCVTLNLDSLFSTWRCTKEHTKKGMMIKLILRQPWLKFFRSLSVILPIRELGLRHDFEIYYHSGRQGFPGPDRNHLRRHHLQRGHHHHNHNYCSALYLQLLGWQRRCGGFLYRHGSRLLLSTIKISSQQNHLHRLFSWKNECNSEAQWN